MPTVYLSLGSNSGESRAILANALDALNKIRGCRVLAASSIYRTEPQDKKNQPWFLNQAACLDTALSPLELLDKTQEIERFFGRERGRETRFGPRTLDLDILLYGALVLEELEGRLTLPHPRLSARAFALIPLLELDPELILPDGRRAADCLKSLPYRLENDLIYQAE
ncbi:2-amino-4-hydroxy-6-hydroxymethyldihydropteridine diphosphokinase [Desulfovibrio sp. OttesenSCG-928-C14]|nr:2-amino-4-hydroxy-6-hydroxymethyldihydropteridine diphosphokinase [Desulfovibrio sp. OttesenSCG-928-C14]